MKTMIKKILLSVCTVLLLSNCTVIGGITPSKTTITRNFNVGNFTSIDFSAVGDISFTQIQGKPTLSIYGPENFVKLVKVSVEGNTLSITMEDKNRIKNTKKMKISISAPTLTNINFVGVGNLSITKPLQINNLEVINKGVGNIEIDSVTGNSLTIHSNGVGDVKLRGKVNVASLACNGVGNVDANELVANVVDANCRGVGSITCYAIDSITAAVRGIGSIKYKGNPKQKDLNRTGIGSIKQY
jgi:hypothetical protein